MRRALILNLLVCLAALIASQGSCATTETQWKKTVDIQVRNLPLADALEVLFKNTGVSYTVDRSIDQLKVTAILKNVALQTAFQELLKAAGAVSKEADGVLYVASAESLADSAAIWHLEAQLAELRARLAAEMQAKTEGHADVRAIKASIAEIEQRLEKERKLLEERLAARRTPTPAPSPGAKELTKVVEVKYLDARDLPELLQAEGLYRVTASEGNKVVIAGREEAVQRALDIIAALDDESARPRPVRVKFTVKFTATDAEGKPKTFEGAVEGVAIEGGHTSLQFVSPLPSDTHIDDDDLDSLHLSANIEVSKVSSDGRVTVTAKGDCIAFWGLVRAPFDFSTSVALGQPQIVKSGTVVSEGRKIALELAVTATLVEKQVQAPTKGQPATAPKAKPTRR